MFNHSERKDITVNALIGQAVGDAFGVPVEFLSRKKVRQIDLKEMVGKESALPFKSQWGGVIPKGSWSDDTSMTIASMASFIRNHGAIDYEDQMKQFDRWWDENEYCCLETPFGLGGTTHMAMGRFLIGVPALDCGGTHEQDNGNGSLMRILPFSLYCVFHGLDLEQTQKIISDASRMTHAHPISQLCCFVWTEFLRGLIAGKSVEDAVMGTEQVPYGKWFSQETMDAVSFVRDKRIREITEQDIGETGYVVDTLYSAFFSLLRGGDYESVIRTAVGLGYDTDTSAAVAGMAAGILYGANHIPERWKKALRSEDVLLKTAEEFAEAVHP